MGSSDLDDDAEIVDNYRLDHLYTNAFHDNSGKYFTVVSRDESDDSIVVDAEQPKPIRNKIKTRLTFIKSPDGGKIKRIFFRRYKYYKNNGYRALPEHIDFSFDYFVGLIGFLQSLSALNLNDITERRIPLHDGPTLDEETRRQFRTLAATEQGQELIREVVRSGQLSGEDIVNISYRKQQLQVFENLLSSEQAIHSYRAEHHVSQAGDEAVWQRFFETNKWIFGYGLNFVFNQPLQGRALETVVRGSDVTGAGKRTDALLKTGGIISSLCLVEIKTSKTQLLHREAYRTDCWRPSLELSGGIAQSQKTVQRTIENLSSFELRPSDDQGNPTGEILYGYNPKSYLIIGSLSEFQTAIGNNKEQLASFELLRRNTNAPEIITFDELLVRARAIVANS